MAKEIERKFLVRNGSWRRIATRHTVLRQGYLTAVGTGLAEVRVRQSQETAYLTIKSKGGLVRDEFEYEIPSQHAAFMLDNLCGTAIIAKRRHEVHHAGLVWMVDEFLERLHGLCLAEVELEMTDQSVELPEWVGDEVTNDARYRNAYLATHSPPSR